MINFLKKSETNLFLSQDADGLLGLSPKEHRFSGFISHLLNNSIIEKRVFSLCIGLNGGMFTIGGVNKTLHFEKEIKYVDYKTEDLYKIHLNSIILESNEFAVKVDTYAGLDTGTTNTYFPVKLYENIYSKIKEYCSYPDRCLGNMLKINNEICFYKKKSMDLGKFYESMPVIKFNLQNNLEIEWNARSYLHSSIKEKNEYCLSFHKWE